MTDPIAGTPRRGKGKEDGAGEGATAKKPGDWAWRAVTLASSHFDWWCAAALVGCGLWLFGGGSHLLGFYADDAGFMTDFQSMSLRHAFWEATNYVPGRNLHILWQYLIFAVTGGPSLGSLPAQHWLQALLTSINAALLFRLLRRLSLQVVPSVAAAWLFLLGPTHGEAHFWLSAFPMNLFSTFFVLCLALSSVATARAALGGGKTDAVRWLAVDCVIFVAGAFTYDQAVPVLAAIAVSTVFTVFWRRRDLALPAFSLAAFVCAVLALLAVWKAHALNGTPGFSSVNMAHISKAFHESLDLVWGRAFRSIAFKWPRRYSTPAIRAEAAWFSAAILCLGLLSVWRDVRTQTSASGPSLKRLLLLLFGAVLFFLLAYFPVYLWFIAPRHTYLPSIGVAGAVGIVAAALLSVLRRHLGPLCAAALGLAAVCGVSRVTYFLAQSVLIDKESWIVSYQARKHLYEDLGHDEKFLSASLFVFESVPLLSPFGSAMLGFQNSTEPSLMTSGATRVRLLRPFSLRAPTGDFIYVELYEWGKDAFVHIPRDEVYRVRYESLDREKMRFVLAETTPAPSLVTVERVEDAAAEPAAEKEARLTRTGPGTLELSLPPTPIPAGSVLAAIPLVGDHPGADPLTSKMPDGRQYMNIVELPVTDDQRSMRFRLRFDPQLAEVKGVSLYVVGASTRRPLGDVFLPR